MSPRFSLTEAKSFQIMKIQSKRAAPEEGGGKTCRGTSQREVLFAQEITT
jgi:hypothetical protein